MELPNTGDVNTVIDIRVQLSVIKVAIISHTGHRPIQLHSGLTEQQDSLLPHILLQLVPVKLMLMWHKCKLYRADCMYVYHVQFLCGPTMNIWIRKIRYGLPLRFLRLLCYRYTFMHALISIGTRFDKWTQITYALIHLCELANKKTYELVGTNSGVFY